MADGDAPENSQNPPADAGADAKEKKAPKEKKTAGESKPEPSEEKKGAPKEKKAGATPEKKKESAPEEKEEGESAPPKEKKPPKSEQESGESAPPKEKKPPKVAQEKKEGADVEGAQKKKGNEPAPEKKGGPEPEAGAPQQKKGIFSKLSEKLKKKAPAEAPAQEKNPEEKKGETPKGGFFSKLFKKKEPAQEEGISLAPTIVSSQPSIGAPQTEAQFQQAEKIITPTVAPVPQETFFQRLRGLFRKEPPMPLEIPTHCAVCGIDLHTVYSYTCSNCRKIACYYCVRSFNEKTYCAKCLKEKGIL